MNKPLVGFLLGLIVGGFGVGIYSYRIKEQQLASMSFQQELYRVQASARTLQMMDESRLDVVRKLADTELYQSVDYSYRDMVEYEPELTGAAPALLDGLERAGAYLASIDRQAKTYHWLQEVTEYVRAAAGQEVEARKAATLTGFAERYAEAWCSRDPESVAAFFAEEGSLRVNGGEPAVGRPAIAAVARGFMKAFPDMRVVLDELVPGSQATFFHWTLTGTNTGPGGGGKSVRISGYEMWRLDEHGLIEKSLGHFDAAEYERQLRHGVDG